MLTNKEKRKTWQWKQNSIIFGLSRELVGPAHVGLGIDYVYDQEHDSRSVWSPHFSGRPIAVLEPEQYPGLTERMLALGYAEDDVRGILGGNWQRVAGAVWR